MVCLWREKRAERCEIGEIQRRGDVRAAWARKQDERFRTAVVFRHRGELECSSRGVQYLLDELAKVLKDLSGGDPGQAGAGLTWYFPDALAAAGFGRTASDGTPLSEGRLDQLRGALEVEQQSLAARLDVLRRSEADRVEAEIARRALPPLAVIKKLQRYTGPNARELHRNLALLYRLQTSRAGNRGGRRSRDAAK